MALKYNKKYTDQAEEMLVRHTTKEKERASNTAREGPVRGTVRLSEKEARDRKKIFSGNIKGVKSGATKSNKAASALVFGVSR